MNRLTYKDDRVFGGYNSVDSDDFACVSKLGKYEDIEEDLNLDLIKILTAKEVYVFGTEVIAPYRLGRTNKIVKCSIFYFDFVNKVVHIHVPKVGLYCEPFSYYGKSWAFTKEELKK